MGTTVYGDSTGRGDVPALGRGGLCFGVLMVTFKAGGPCVWLSACMSLWLVDPACCHKRPHLWHRRCGTQGTVVGPSGMLRPHAVRKIWSFVKHQCRASGRGEDPLNNQIVKYCFDLFLFIIF